MAGSRGARPEKTNPDVVRAVGRQVGTVQASRATKAQMAESEHYDKQYDSDGPMDRLRYQGSSDIDLDPSSARITAQLKFMAEQIGELSALIYELEERVSPILLPPFPQPSDPDVPGSATSEISRVIDDHNGSLSELQRRVRGINMRVQL